MQAKLQEQFSPTDAEVIWGRLPERIQATPIARAAEIEYPIAAVIEMAIASFLDTEALAFVDCKPGRGQKNREVPGDEVPDKVKARSLK
jgi:hypothetical protein